MVAFGKKKQGAAGTHFGSSQQQDAAAGASQASAEAPGSTASYTALYSQQQGAQGAAGSQQRAGASAPQQQAYQSQQSYQRPAGYQAASQSGYTGGQASQAGSTSGSAATVTGLNAGTSTRIVDGKAKPIAKRRHKLRNRIIVGVCATLLVVLAGVCVAAGVYINSITSQMSYDDEEAAELADALVAVESSEDPYYVLILGSDSRTEDTSGTRSDTIILARVDPVNAVVHLISIPRDTMVTIDGYGTCKINAAYAYGGASLAVEVVSEFAGVDIAQVVEVSFDALVDVVDLLGGIEIDVEEEVSYGGVTVYEGLQTLSGEEALVYARDRKHVTGGDFGRAAHQREVIEAIVDKALSSSSLTTLTSIVTDVAQNVSTSYSLTGLISLATTFYGKDITFYSVSCPSYTYNYNSVSYVATMYDEWKEIMQRTDAGLDPEGDDEIPEEQLNDERLGACTNGAGPTDYESLAASSMTTDVVDD